MSEQRFDGRAMRDIGEPISEARNEAALVECHIHESLLNVAFRDEPNFWSLCPYDTASLPTRVVEQTIVNHPFECDGVSRYIGAKTPTKGDAMAKRERTRPSDETRAAEAVDAREVAHADRPPTKDEEEAAERERVADDDTAQAYEEALERGARQQGEGRVP